MRFVFVAELADGRELRESESVFWDHVPRDVGITRVSLRDTANEDRVLVGISAQPARRFFFSNEALCMKGEQAIPSGKILGLIDGDQVFEWRLDFGLLSRGRVAIEKRVYPLAELELDASTHRKAA